MSFDQFVKNSIKTVTQEIVTGINAARLGREDVTHLLQREINEIARYIRPADVDKIIRLQALATILDWCEFDHVARRNGIEFVEVAE